jgi:hypothetical protein
VRKRSATFDQNAAVFLNALALTVYDDAKMAAKTVASRLDSTRAAGPARCKHLRDDGLD